MPQVFTNNATGELSVAIDASILQVLLKTGDGANFPVVNPPDYFLATMEDTLGNFEIVKVIGSAGPDLFNFEARGHEGTTPLSFSDGDRFELRMTAASLEVYLQRDGDVVDGGTY